MVKFINYMDGSSHSAASFDQYQCSKRKSLLTCPQTYRSRLPLMNPGFMCSKKSHSSLINYVKLDRCIDSHIC